MNLFTLVGIKVRPQKNILMQGSCLTALLLVWLPSSSLSNLGHHLWLRNLRRCFWRQSLRGGVFFRSWSTLGQKWATHHSFKFWLILKEGHSCFELFRRKLSTWRNLIFRGSPDYLVLWWLLVWFRCWLLVSSPVECVISFAVFAIRSVYFMRLELWTWRDQVAKWVYFRAHACKSIYALNICLLGWQPAGLKGSFIRT